MNVALHKYLQKSIPLASILIFLWVPSGHAALVLGLCNGLYSEKVSCDTDTGHEWLRLTESTNISYNDMSVLLADPTSEFYGFQRASQADLRSMFYSAGVVTENDRSVENVPGVINLLTLIGATDVQRHLAEPWRFFVAGVGITSDVYTLNVGPSHFGSYYFVEYGWIDNLDSVTGYASLDFHSLVTLDHLGTSTIGHYLYRVPEPTTTILFAIGLVGLGLSRVFRPRMN